MNLQEWQSRLGEHFQKIREARQSGPVFALEHGLDQTLIDQLCTALRQWVPDSPPSEKHWLPWVIYASEVGYSYVGYEYWQTFEARTLGWSRWQLKREWLRSQFHSFEKAYRGAVPSGPWAEKFSIICHPITHAILPKDFQSQLTQVLYDIRGLFTKDVLQTERMLGELIRDASIRQSNRFRQFVQDVQIVGLIAKALLAEQTELSESVLLPHTLHRIVQDLSREEVALERLTDARKSALRVQRLGLFGGRPRHDNAHGERSRTGNDVNLQPTFQLSPVAPGQWNLSLNLPDFTPLATLNPTLNRLLEEQRCYVAGARKPLPRSALLFGRNLVPLCQYPRRTESVLSFGDELPAEESREFKGILNDHVSFAPGARALCRISKDGRAYQVRQLVVRPGRGYIYLSADDLPTTADYMRRVDIVCSGVFAYKLTIPDSITHELELRLKSVGLSLAGKVGLVPAGIPPAAWDGEGYGEWLIGDPVNLGVKSEFNYDNLRLELSGLGDALDIRPVEAGRTYFFKLPQLPPGTHYLTVSTSGPLMEEDCEIGQLEIGIREARDWRSAIYEHGSLTFAVEPRAPTLEELLQGKVTLQVTGPADRMVKVTTEVFGRASATSHQGPIAATELQLPIDRNAGREFLLRYVRSGELYTALDSAYAAHMHFNGSEFGNFTLTFEREFAPLRWYAERSSDHYNLTLSDDTGGGERTTVSHFTFQRPDHATSVQYDHRLEDYTAPTAGGLFTAECADFQIGLVLPSNVGTVALRTFADLGRTSVTPQLTRRQPTLETVKELLLIDERWAAARLINSAYAALSRQRVRQELIAQIFSVLVGPRWAAAEKNYLDNPMRPGAAECLRDALGCNAETQVELFELGSATDACSPEDYAVGLKGILQPHIRQVPVPRQSGPVVIRGSLWQAKLALRLASAPETVRGWARNSFDVGLAELKNNQILTSAARFVVLTSSFRLRQGNQDIAGGLYPGWEWV
jgi:hypothetical protein